MKWLVYYYDGNDNKVAHVEADTPQEAIDIVKAQGTYNDASLVMAIDGDLVYTYTEHGEDGFFNQGTVMVVGNAESYPFGTAVPSL